MRTILLWGVLLTLSLTGCSSSANSLTGSDDIQPFVDPHTKVGGPCQLPTSDSTRHISATASAFGWGTLPVRYRLRRCGPPPWLQA
jgi:hypothetical protein